VNAPPAAPSLTPALEVAAAAAGLEAGVRVMNGVPLADAEVREKKLKAGGDAAEAVAAAESDERVITGGRTEPVANPNPAADDEASAVEPALAMDAGIGVSGIDVADPAQSVADTVTVAVETMVTVTIPSVPMTTVGVMAAALEEIDADEGMAVGIAVMFGTEKADGAIVLDLPLSTANGAVTTAVADEENADEAVNWRLLRKTVVENAPVGIAADDSGAATRVIVVGAGAMYDWLPDTTTEEAVGLLVSEAVGVASFTEIGVGVAVDVEESSSSSSQSSSVTVVSAPSSSQLSSPSIVPSSSSSSVDVEVVDAVVSVPLSPPVTPAAWKR